MKIFEVEMKQKAGIVPFLFDGERVKMLFMVPSNPNFGGTKWQIAKGKVDPGESVTEAALREGKEELGFKLSNIASFTLVTSQVITGDDETYNLTVYAAQVKDPKDFDSVDFETGGRKWLTVDEFAQQGRPSHLPIVQLLYQKVSS